MPIFKSRYRVTGSAYLKGWLDGYNFRCATHVKDIAEKEYRKKEHALERALKKENKKIK